MADGVVLTLEEGYDYDYVNYKGAERSMSAAIFVDSGATLAIEGGKIYSEVEWYAILANLGTLNLKNVDLEINNEDAFYPVLQNLTKGVVVIDGGNLKSNAFDHLIYNDNGATGAENISYLTIKGGAVLDQTAGNEAISNFGVVVVEDATIKGGDDKYSDVIANHTAKAVVTFNAGANVVAYGTLDCYTLETGSVIINGGTFNKKPVASSYVEINGTVINNGDGTWTVA